jgi:hypothetical protein
MAHILYHAIADILYHAIADILYQAIADILYQTVADILYQTVADILYQTVADIPQVHSAAVDLFLNVILICYSYSQIFGLCHTFKGFIVCVCVL